MSLLFSSANSHKVSLTPPKKTDQLLLVSTAEVGLVGAGVCHHLEPRLVDNVQQVLGIDGESVSCRQHLFLVVLLETGTEGTHALIIINIVLFIIIVIIITVDVVLFITQSGTNVF